jgi:hypothetical protein
MAGLVDYIPPFLPTKPKPALDYYSFPNDLISDGRQFCMDIQFLEYDASLTNIGMFFPSVATYFPSAAYTPTGGITLPIPKKLNDVQTVVWDSVSATGAAASVASTFSSLAARATGLGAGVANAGSVIGALIPGGLAVNPHLFMLFKQPTFKEYTLSWTFAPKNEQESLTLAKIIDYFKFNMLPARAGGIFADLGLNYPSIAMIKMYPNDFFTFRFKPCAVKSVQVDYTGAGVPSFFKRTGAPTVVNFTVYLQEIQYNIKDNYYL